MDLAGLGWSEFFARAFAPHAAEGRRAGRVALEHKHAYVLLTETGERLGALAGRVLKATSGSALPTVGDWVAYEERTGSTRVIIHAILPRRTAFSRRAAGERGGEQVVAANIDKLFLLSDLDIDFNLRRIERYLAVARGSGAAAVLVLNKLDLCLDSAAKLAEARRVAGDAPVHAISAEQGIGLDPLRAHLGSGRTIALLGSSGVGKSTLANRLFGAARLAVGAVKLDDGRGRHTTTRRELIRLDDGTLLIDTPGMRELQLWVTAREGLWAAFPDILELGRGCRFRDCRHGAEPGCAVRAAMADGSLPAKRFANFEKLRRELEELENAGSPGRRESMRVKGRRIMRG